MDRWPVIVPVVAAALLLAAGGIALWLRSGRNPDTAASLRDLADDLVRLPGRLRRVAADPRTPRRARWLLILLAIYVASPIDPIPDFIPGIGHLDELVIVPLALVRIRRMIPPEVWDEHFPPRRRDGAAD